VGRLGPPAQALALLPLVVVALALRSTLATHWRPLSETEYFRRLATTHPHAPRLLLFGEADTMVPAADVRHFAATAFPPAARVTAVAFPDGRHVQLPRQFPDQYATALVAFLATVEKADPSERSG